MPSASFDNGHRWLGLILALLCSGLLCYSQATTLDWDEGFHLVAARLVAAGQRPYIDFCLPQPSLHTWWNALWLNVTGGGWRGPHLIAALLTGAAVVLTADYVARRFSPVAACAAALLVGLNAVVVQFGTTAQAYGVGTFLTVAAFRATVARPAILLAALAGCLAGAAAGCSLLTAPVCLVLFVWHAWYRPRTHTAAYVAGVVLVWLPLLFSFFEAPYQTWFNLAGYHLFYRHSGWEATTRNDLRVLFSWATSGPALLIALLTIAGLRYSRTHRPELVLAVILAGALAAEAAPAHPTFHQYFIFLTPFLAIPAAVGFREAAARLSLPIRWALPALAGVLIVALSSSLIEMRDSNNTWTSMDLLATKIRQVTPVGGLVLADPPVYFALRQAPPSGMEFPASHMLELTRDQAALLHIVPQSVLAGRVRAGEFATVETCKGDEEDIAALELPRLYAHSATFSGCDVYWGFR